MNPNNSSQRARLLQQQPERQANRQQQQSSGSGEYQPGKSQQMGESGYAAAEDYKNSIRSYLKKADVKAEALAGRPTRRAEAEEIRRAEQEGKSRSKARGE